MDFLERMNAQNLQSSVESAGQHELLVKDRDHQIGADRNPDLGLHRDLDYLRLKLRHHSVLR
jgi:hypothetical protein